MPRCEAVGLDKGISSGQLFSYNVINGWWLRVCNFLGIGLNFGFLCSNLIVVSLLQKYDLKITQKPNHSLQVLPGRELVMRST